MNFSANAERFCVVRFPLDKMDGPEALDLWILAIRKRRKERCRRTSLTWTAATLACRLLSLALLVPSMATMEGVNRAELVDSRLADVLLGRLAMVIWPERLRCSSLED